MKLKNILLLSTLAALSTACSNDNIDGELPLTGAANEIQLVIGGNDESVEYTKAIASDSENKIENLDVYIFASDADGGTYKYLDTWKSAATNDKVLKTFAMQSAGSAWNASIFPEEVSGYPFLKLYLVANREDGLYQENGTATQTLTAFTGAGDFATATDEAAFLQSFSKALAADQILHPSLLMTGNGATKMLGTVSKVDIELKRVVARFDIDNTARTSNLTIETIALNQGRKTGPLWPVGTMTTVADADLPTSGLLTAYKEVDYTALTNANQGVTESAIYTYPTLSTDKVELIITGQYHDPVSNTNKAATYTVPLQKTDDTGTTSPISILRNNRYKLRIIDVTNTTMAAVFEIEDWTSGGGISIKPENDAPIFKDVAALFTGSTDTPTAIAGESNSFRVSNAGSFKVTLAATGRITAVKTAVTKADAATDWLVITASQNDDYVVKNGVTYTTFNFTVTDATSKSATVIFMNEAASNDPALQLSLTFAGPE